MALGLIFFVLDLLPFVFDTDRPGVRIRSSGDGGMGSDHSHLQSGVLVRAEYHTASLSATIRPGLALPEKNGG